MTSTNVPVADTAPSAAHRRPARVISRAVLAAVLVNLAVWAVGALAGGSFELVEDGKASSVAPGGVVVLSAVPLARLRQPLRAAVHTTAQDRTGPQPLPGNG